MVRGRKSDHKQEKAPCPRSRGKIAKAYLERRVMKDRLQAGVFGMQKNRQALREEGTMPS